MQSHEKGRTDMFALSALLLFISMESDWAKELRLANQGVLWYALNAIIAQAESMR